MQDLVNPLPFGKRSNNSPIQSKENQMEICLPHLRKSQKFHGLRPWKKEMIPKRAITVGYNGPTKVNVTLEGMLKDINQNLRTRVLYL